MNRKELVAAIAAHTGQDTKTVDASMRGVVDVTLASVAKGETVQMPGFESSPRSSAPPAWAAIPPPARRSRSRRP